ncbi:MAG: type II toxin-antitoxin system HicB family antitoxin [Bacteroidales bacterium]|nr:type II toxin-antitoxin system HicB family antitoxin [Bacteroidales bacterium]
MNKLYINIDWVPNNFSAVPADEGLACVATGNTLEEVKENIISALKFHVEGLVENGDHVPDTLNGEWVPEFILTTRAQLKYCDLYITRKALAKETGVNEQQLSHYANGQRHPRPAMQHRISDGIRSIRDRLNGIL